MISIPDFCYALNNMTINPETKIGEVIIVRGLEKGYYPTQMKLTQSQVDDLNIDLGITRAISRSMETASMFGWETYLKSFEEMEKHYALLKRE
jgi:hypothetical protein